MLRRVAVTSTTRFGRRVRSPSVTWLWRGRRAARWWCAARTSCATRSFPTPPPGPSTACSATAVQCCSSSARAPTSRHRWPLSLLWLWPFTSRQLRTVRARCSPLQRSTERRALRRSRTDTSIPRRLQWRTGFLKSAKLRRSPHRPATRPTRTRASALTRLGFTLQMLPQL